MTEVVADCWSSVVTVAVVTKFRLRRLLLLLLFFLSDEVAVSSSREEDVADCLEEGPDVVDMVDITLLLLMQLFVCVTQ